jgi:cysteine synthase A
MPDTMSMERRMLLRAYGAELVLTPGAEGMRGAIRQGRRDGGRRPALLHPAAVPEPGQPGNPPPTTAEEIWNDTDGQVDILVAAWAPAARSPAWPRSSRPASRRSRPSPSSRPTRRCSPAAAGPAQDSGHRRGLRAGVLNTGIIDEVIRVTNDDAISHRPARRRKEEGMLVGISSGAAVHAARQVARRPENAGKLIVALSSRRTASAT